MRQNLLILFVVVAGLACTGAVGNRIAAPAWERLRADEPALRLESTAMAAQQGATLSLLGGFRALVADVLWIRMHAGWEARELAGTDALLRLVPAIDPRPVFFWLNGTRIVAHDFAAWRIEAAGGYDTLAHETQREIRAEQVRRALEHLARGMSFHPENAALWIERASLELHGLGDIAAAAESFRRAAELPGAPFHAGRLHAEMLRRAGRNAEALAWLKRIHPGLPPDDDTAGAELVLARIRDLERLLAVPPAQRFEPAR